MLRLLLRGRHWNHPVKTVHGRLALKNQRKQQARQQPERNIDFPDCHCRIQFT